MTTTLLRPMRTVTEAEIVGYLVTRSEAPRLGHSWWLRCERLQQPWIVVTLGTKWASVRMDMFTLNKPPRDLTSDQQERLQGVLRTAAIAVMEAGLKRSVYFGAGPSYVSITRCRQEDIEELIAALLKEGREAPVKTRR